MAKMVKLGSKEMKGILWDEGGKSDIAQILISHQQDYINSIQFLYFSKGGTLSEPHGKADGLKFDTVVIDHPTEFLTSVTGAYLTGRLASIVFVTNRRKYGPFGTVVVGVGVWVREFNYNFGLMPGNNQMGCFGGFHGSVSNGFVSGIGVYVKPLNVVDTKRFNIDDDDDDDDDDFLKRILI